MEEVFMDRVEIGRYYWVILDNLKEFEGHEEKWERLYSLQKQVKDHFILSSFDNLIEAINVKYKQTGGFPTVEMLKVEFRDVRPIVITNDRFSWDIYNYLVKFIEQENLKYKYLQALEPTDKLEKAEDWKELAENFKTFADTSKPVTERSWDDLIMAGYNEKEEGLKTGIDRLDEVIDSLDAKSLCTVAFPSGHGKTLTALNIAYNLIKEGKKVTYISYELPAERILNCLISISSFGTDKKLINSKISKHLLSDEEKAYRIELAKALPLENLTILDNTDLSNIKSFHELLELLEERGKETAQGLIIIDNLDSFGRYSKNKNDSRNEINSMISALEPFAQTYCDNKGCVVLGLAQCNRSGIAKLDQSFTTEKAVTIDYTCISEYSSSYERARTVILGYCGDSYRKVGKLAYTLVKSTFKPVNGEIVTVAVDFDTLAINNKAKLSMPAISKAETEELDDLKKQLEEME